MWKHFGCAMSSRFTPPNEGVMSLTVSMIFSGSFVARGIGNASTPPRYLNNRDLPSITGNPASGPMSPRPRTPIVNESRAGTSVPTGSGCRSESLAGADWEPAGASEGLDDPTWAAGGAGVGPGALDADRTPCD